MDKNKWFALCDMKWISPGTNKMYKRLGRRILKYWEGDNFTQSSVDNFYMELVKGTRPGNNVNVAARAFLKNYIACYEDDVEDAGMRRIKLVAPGSRGRKKVNAYRFLTYDGLCEMLSVLESPQLLVMVNVMFETGLRATEITSIRREDIDLVDRTISGVGKGNKEFRIPISMKTADLLEKWFNYAPIVDYPFKIMMMTKPILRRNQGQALCEFMSRELEKVGFRHITPHMIRHTFGHFLRHDKQFDLLDIKTALRHESVTSTEIYAVSTPEEVNDKIRSQVFGEQSPETSNSKADMEPRRLPRPRRYKMVRHYKDPKDYLRQVTEEFNRCRVFNMPIVPSKFGLTEAIVDGHQNRLAHIWVKSSIHFTRRL